MKYLEQLILVIKQLKPFVLIYYLHHKHLSVVLNYTINFKIFINFMTKSPKEKLDLTNFGNSVHYLLFMMHISKFRAI